LPAKGEYTSELSVALGEREAEDNLEKGLQGTARETERLRKKKKPNIRWLERKIQSDKEGKEGKI